MRYFGSSVVWLPHAQCALENTPIHHPCRFEFVCVCVCLLGYYIVNVRLQKEAELDKWNTICLRVIDVTELNLKKGTQAHNRNIRGYK